MDMINQKILLGLILTLILISLLGCEQMRVDAQMEALCEQDGGMKIYEKVVLPKKVFKYGGNPVFYKTWNSSGGGYRFDSKLQQIKRIKPTLDKVTYTVIREKDNQILGSLVMYHRIGGGIMPTLGPDPAKHCPINVDDGLFLKMIFVQEN